MFDFSGHQIDTFAKRTGGIMPIITNTFIQKLKKRAKAECKASSLSLTQVQDEIAREYGYLNWRTLVTYKNSGAVKVDDAEQWFRQKYSDSCNRSPKTKKR